MKLNIIQWGHAVKIAIIDCHENVERNPRQVYSEFWGLFPVSVLRIALPVILKVLFIRLKRESDGVLLQIPLGV